MNSPVTKLYSDFEKLKDFLLSNGQLDHYNMIQRDYQKILLISSASYIETIVQEVIINYVDYNSSHELILNFLKNKAISRQYHTYFNWDGNNINSFLGLFGSEFKSDISNKIKNDEKTKNNIKSFLELGNLRNELVHQNFINYTIQKTPEEIKTLFDNALLAVKFMKDELNLYNKKDMNYEIMFYSNSSL